MPLTEVWGNWFCLWKKLHLWGYLQRVISLLKWLNWFFSSFPSKLACSQNPQTAFWSLLFLCPRWSLFCWATQRPLGEQEKACLEVTCLAWRLPALGRTQGCHWLEDWGRWGVGRSRSHIHVVLAGRDALHWGRLGSFQGITVQKPGKSK